MNRDGFKNDSRTLVVCRLGGQRYALDLDTVVRIIRAAAPTPVPGTPGFVLGLVNMAGQLVPVISLRRCLGLPECSIKPEDHFVIVRTTRFNLALVVDEVERLSVVDAAQTVAVEGSLLGEDCRVQGLVKINGDIILIYDLETLLSPADSDRILQAKAIAEE